jgi:hypothetical protein
MVQISDLNLHKHFWIEINVIFQPNQSKKVSGGKV